MDATTHTLRTDARGNGFFLFMAIAISATVIGGFGSFALRGMVNARAAPFWVHLHGAVFMAWTLLYVAQAALAASGSLALHRRMGWSALGLATVMVPLGAVTAMMAVVRDRVPPFFTPEIFLALSALELAAFVLLLTLAIRARRRSDWHKRLMLCAMVAIIGPAFGRILPMPLLGSMGGLAVLVGQMMFVLIAIGHDILTRRRIHPAYGIGAAVIIVEGMAVPLLAASAPFVALAAALAG